MIRLDDLGLFARSAALGSFSNAAREAGLLPGQVSAAIQRLERELDIRLFARSTRSLRLTAEGESYLVHAQDALDSLRAGHERLHGQGPQLQGVLHVAAPSDLGRSLVLPWLSAFRREHPALSLRFLVSDQVSDVFRDPVDVAIRYSRMEDASYVALPLLTENRRVLVASPDYIERHGQPHTLEALGQHACLLYTLGGRVYDKWSFTQPDGARQTMTANGVLSSDDGHIVHQWALAGEGIAYKSAVDVHDDLMAGRLQVLLPRLTGDPAPLHLVCPHRRQYSPAIQKLHAWLKTRFAEHVRSPQP